MHGNELHLIDLDNGIPHTLTIKVLLQLVQLRTFNVFSRRTILTEIRIYHIPNDDLRVTLHSLVYHLGTKILNIER